MHIAQVNFPCAPAGLALEEIFERWPTLVDVAEAVASAGLRVTVIQAATHDRKITRNGVEYRFVVAGTKARDRNAGVAALLTQIEADVLHVHGFEYAREAFAISQRLPRLPILLQDHANRMPRWWRRLWWRRWYSATWGVAITTVEQAQPFLSAKMFPASMPIFAIPESSCRFVPGDRALARRETGLHGDPGVLWIGHLNEEKGILTVLDGVSRAISKLPDLHLWCAFGSAPVLDDVQKRIARDPNLEGRVHLLGQVARSHVEKLMRAADLFVSGSLRESSGYALLEALACGIPPVVTDIPSFRAMTDQGRIGRLWPRGDDRLCAEALVHAATYRLSAQQVRAHFDARLSFAALGNLWADAYRRVCEAKPRDRA